MMSWQPLYWTGRTIVDLYARLALDMDVAREADWPDGPKIVAANHPTTTDPFFLMTVVPEQMSILVTEMAFDVPVFGDYLRAIEQIPVVHGKGSTAMEQATRQLERGRTIGIFPEGALSPLAGGSGLPRAHTGAVRLSLRTKAPIVPVGIYLDPARIHYAEVSAGTQSETARWYTSGPYALTVGKAIYLDGEVSDRAFVRSASQRVMQEIVHLARQSDRRIRGRAFQRRMRRLGQWEAMERI
jgi:1-acyl-sn-glycerol-3-phosphate acyltransferase